MSYSEAGQSFGQGFGLLGSAFSGSARAGGQRLMNSIKANKKLWAFIAFLIIALIIVLVIFLGDKYGGWLRKKNTGESCNRGDGDCDTGLICGDTGKCQPNCTCPTCNPANVTSCAPFCT